MNVMGTRFIYAPAWLEPTDPDQMDRWREFCIELEWRGETKWAVVNQGRWLSRAGHWKHIGLVERYQYRQYRFTSGEAHDWAEKIIDGITLMGHTHDEWVEELARRAASA